MLARITKPLEDIVFKVDGEPQRIRYFLMSVVHEGRPGEGRRSSWLSPEAAVKRLSWRKSQALIRKAVDVLDVPAVIATSSRPVCSWPVPFPRPG